MLEILDFHGNDSPTEELERVVLLPFGNYSSSTLDISPHKWTDFEEIIFTSKSASSLHVYAPEAIQKEVIAANPTSWEATMGYNDPQTGFVISIAATGESSSTLTYANVGTVLLGSVVGLKKRYATKNLSKTIVLAPDNTTGGTFVNGEIQLSSRYSLDIATVLGSDYIGKDLIVKAEVFNNTGSGVADWGESPYVKGGDGSGDWAFGVNASQIGDYIVVQAPNGSSDSAFIPTYSDWNGNGFGNSGVDSRSCECRIKVWTVEQYVTNNTLDLITALEARIAALENA